MKTIKIFFIMAVCSVMLFGISCSNENLSVDDLAQSGLRAGAEENEEEPVIEDGIIPFTEFQPAGYKIINLPADSLAVINSQEEFDYYFDPGKVSPEEALDSLPFDFSEKTLLFTYGSSISSINNISKEIIKTGDAYSLTVNVTFNDDIDGAKWYLGFVIDKADVTEVEFNLTKEGGHVFGEKESVGYIVGYEYCGLELDAEKGTGKAEGYIFISEDRKDTLAIFGLPDDIFVFPIEVFDAYIKSPDHGTDNAFPGEYLSSYQIQLKYRDTADDSEFTEKGYRDCVRPALFWGGSYFGKLRPVFVENARKIEQK
jgi:hypothetical protein